MGIRVFWFLGPTALAGCVYKRPTSSRVHELMRHSAFGGLIAYGVGHIQSTALAKWKYLFIIEAIPTICLGLFMLYWLPDRPLKNSRFSSENQQIAEARYYSEDYDKAGKIEWKHIIMTFSDWRLYAQVAVYLPTACLLSSISGFLPTIVTGMCCIFRSR